MIGARGWSVVLYCSFEFYGLLPLLFAEFCIVSLGCLGLLLTVQVIMKLLARISSWISLEPLIFLVYSCLDFLWFVTGSVVDERIELFVDASSRSVEVFGFVYHLRGY